MKSGLGGDFIQYEPTGPEAHGLDGWKQNVVEPMPATFRSFQLVTGRETLRDGERSPAERPSTTMATTGSSPWSAFPSRSA